MPGEDLPPLSVDDRTLSEWVSRRLTALDDVPGRRNWRWESLGRKTVGQAVAEIGEHRYRMTFNIPIPEMRLLTRCAYERSLPPLVYARQAIGTVMTVIDHVDAESIPFFTGGGFIRPVRDG